MALREEGMKILLILALFSSFHKVKRFGFAISLQHLTELLPLPGPNFVDRNEIKISLLPVAESETRGRSLLDGGDWLMAFCPKCQSSDDVMLYSEQLQFHQAVIPSAFAENFPFNDTIRNYYGWLLYRRAVPYTPQDRLVLRFESVVYQADIFVNQIKIGTHFGGHLPFEFDITGFIKRYASTFALDVAVNTVLTYDTIPPGILKTDPATNYTYQDYLFDFFHYCGILRSVWLYWTPHSYILDATIVTNAIDSASGMASVGYNVSYVCSQGVTACSIESQIYDPTGNPVGPLLLGPTQTNILIKDAIFWTPVDYRKDKGEDVNQYYHLSMAVKHNGRIVDVYYQAFGIRTVQVNQTGLYINNQPLYCRGVGKHEDWPLMGRAFSKQAVLHDFRIFRWLGGNCLRTSHYPYASYFYELADKFGVAVISEAPAVGLRYYQTFKSANAQIQHAVELTEMYQAQKNHPSIIAWSLANEPLVTAPESRPYFQPLFALMRNLDPLRPVLFVNGDHAVGLQNYLSEMSDISCLNRYFGWYIQTGQLDRIERSIIGNIVNFYQAYPDKPVIITEYGAEAISGVHSENAQLFSEEYQAQVLSKTHSAFDAILANRSAPLIGELIWNYADFQAQSRDMSRMNGFNNKGIFTRSRQPKSAAQIIRRRYHALALRMTNRMLIINNNNIYTVRNRIIRTHV